MDTKEAYSLQRKAVEVLFKNDVHTAFDWIINYHFKWDIEKDEKFIVEDILENAHVSATNSKIDEETPRTTSKLDKLSGYDFDYSFQYKNNEYKVSCNNIHTSFGNPYGSYTGGDFYLFFNKKLVFQTIVFRDEVEGGWALSYTTDTDGERGDIKICKVDDWVKDLPHLIRSDKEKFELKDKERQIAAEELDKKYTLDETKKNFELGEFDD